MKSETECEVLAKSKLEEYVNACKCDNKGELLLAIQKMAAMAVHAHQVVEHGQKDPVQ